jgi:hypothetical protein
VVHKIIFLNSYRVACVFYKPVNFLLVLQFANYL